MATTPNYGWTVPTVGGDSGAWGTILNAAFNAADASLKTIDNLVNTMLPKSGGTMTGALTAKTTAQVRSFLGGVSGTVTLDLSQFQFYSATISGNTTFALSNWPTGGVTSGFSLLLTNPGAFTITWPTGTKWPGGAPPAFTVSGMDRVVFISDDAGVTWHAVVVGQDIR